MRGAKVKWHGFSFAHTVPTYTCKIIPNIIIVVILIHSVITVSSASISRSLGSDKTRAGKSERVEEQGPINQ